MVQQTRQVSPDGKWLWNGAGWVPHMPAPIAQPLVPWAKPYESARQRATLVTIFLLASIVGLIALAIFNVLVPGGQASSDAQALAVGIWALLALVVYLGTLIPSIVFFCMWLHRVVRNMPALGSWDARWSPAGAVGRCFIPFLNLAHPMSGTLDAWRASDPTQRWASWPIRKQIRPPALIVAWWSAWLIGNVVSNIGSRFVSSSDSATVGTGDALLIIGNLLLIGAAVLAVLVVRAVTARQDRKNELIATGQLA